MVVEILTHLIVASQNPDHLGTIPPYEQIYALAGLAQYYRITLEWEVLEDIRRTINTFHDIYWDPPAAKERGLQVPAVITPISTMQPCGPDTQALGNNRSRKNWNSVEDHIPAYLIHQRTPGLFAARKAGDLPHSRQWRGRDFGSKAAAAQLFPD
jgi:hypothetical protein